MLKASLFQLGVYAPYFVWPILREFNCKYPVYRNGSRVDAQDYSTPFFYSCVSFVRVEIFTVYFNFLLTACILQARVYALYGRDKKVLTVMVIFYLIALSLISWAMVTDMVPATSTVTSIGPGGKVCPFPPLSKASFGVWVPAIVFESGLFSMVLYKGYQNLKYSGGKNKPAALLKILVRDSAIYFIVLTVTMYVTTMAVWLTEPIGYLAIPASITVSMNCILASRMVLNIRQAAIEQQPSSTRNVVPLIVRRGGAESGDLMLGTGRK
ncbi:hypothetical protein D9613_010919 [Agrocybe pediades]|uniref:Uncharacterized protein n=1 Tax=Agrocybe pediades TaxID=84607 RepID=A0A8H4VKR2_9AGAR|nr:hypothetical protein D9613_010919 [Agrocybe pediades]